MCLHRKKKVFPRTSFQLLTVCRRYYVVIIRPPQWWWWRRRRQLCPSHSMCSLLMSFGQYKHGMTVFPFRFDWIFLFVRAAHFFLLSAARACVLFFHRQVELHTCRCYKAKYLIHIYGWNFAIAVVLRIYAKRDEKKNCPKWCPSIWERRQCGSTKRMQFILRCSIRMGFVARFILFYLFTVAPYAVRWTR